MSTVEIIYEIIGYTGMAFVVASFLFKNVKILRFLNVIGGVMSAVYGILTNTWPTAILNICLCLINISFPVRYIYHKKHTGMDELTVKEEDNKEDK